MRVFILCAALCCPTAQAQTRQLTPFGDQFAPSPLARYGPEGQAALQRCPDKVAAKLSAFLLTGALDWLPKPSAALKVIAQVGPSAAEWVMANVEQLREPAAFEVFLESPECFVYGQKSLPEEAAIRKERRDAGWHLQFDRSMFIGAAGGALCGFLIACLLFRKGPGKPTV